MKSNSIVNILLLISLFFLFSLSHSLVEKKRSLYIDEVSSFLNANREIISFEKAVDSYKKNRLSQLGNELIDRVRVGEFTYQDFINEMLAINKHPNFFNIYVTQTFGDSHPPLYHFLLNSVSWISQSSNVNKIGFGINIFFLLITCVFLFKIGKELSDPWVGLLSVLFYGFTYEFFIRATFFRMYAMVTCMSTALAFLYLKFWHNPQNKPILISICSLQFLSFFTHYFSIFFILPLVYITLKKVNANKAIKKQYIRANIITMIVFLIVWPQFIYQMYRGLFLVGKNIGWSYPLHIARYVNLTISSFFAESKILFFLFIGIMLFVYYKFYGGKVLNIKHLLNVNTISPFNLLFLSLAFYYIVVVVVSPFVAHRYLALIAPLVSYVIVRTIVEFIEIVSVQKSVIQKSLRIGSIIILFGLLWINYHRPNPFLFEETPEHLDFENKYKDITAIIVDPDEDITYMDIPMHFRHSKYIKSYETYIKKNVGSLMKERSYVLYIRKDCKSAYSLFEGLNYMLVPLNNFNGLYNVYSIHKKQ